MNIKDVNDLTPFQLEVILILGKILKAVSVPEE